MTARLGADDVRRIADLARLRLADEEAARFAEQFGRVLDLLDRVRSVPVDGVAPFLHPLAVADVLRDDVPRPGLSRSDALAAAPDTDGGAFRVPRVLPDGEG